MENFKKDTIESIKKINYNESITKAIVDFIESFDGTNEKEFATLMFALILLLSTAQKNELEAKAYNSIKEFKNVFDEGLNRLKDDYKNIKDNKLPSTPAQPNSTESA